MLYINNKINTLFTKNKFLNFVVNMVTMVTYIINVLAGIKGLMYELEVI